MKKNKVVVNKNSKELAATLGLSPLDAIEWEVRLMITNKIISSTERSELTVTDIAKIAGTSRSRITKILKPCQQRTGQPSSEQVDCTILAWRASEARWNTSPIWEPPPTPIWTRVNYSS